MKVVGIIAEYNPFHFGHQYQLDRIREETGADYIVIAMSGDFVQRGEPAIFDKYTRAQMALQAGADLVLELPSCFAVSSAEDFAACGVALLDRLGVVDMLCFGSELGSVKELSAVAEILADETPEYTDMLKELLRQGQSFPAARSQALASLLSDHPDSVIAQADWNEILSASNNTLGIEYLKALKRRNSSMIPVTIQRRGQCYTDCALPGIKEQAVICQDSTSFDSVSFDSALFNSASLDSASLGSAHFASATAIRSAFYDGHYEEAMEHMPFFPVEVPGNSMATVITSASHVQSCPMVYPKDISGLLNMKLLELARDGQDLTAFSDVSRELADRIGKQTLSFASFPERVAALKTRQYTYTRVSRALLHILLNITDEQIQNSRALDYAPYARVLGFRRPSAALMKEIKQNADLPLITKTADAQSLLDAAAYEMLQHDFFCSHLYQSLQQQKGGICPLNEYTHSPVLL